MKSNINEIFNQVARGKIKNVVNSSIFLSLYTNDYEEEPHLPLELGVAIMTDKPIALLVPNGTTVPNHLKKIAVGIEYWEKGDNKDYKRACTKIIKSTIQKIKIGEPTDYCLAQKENNDN